MKAGLHASPLFSQILAMMVAVALCAPVFHFLVVLVVRPALPTYSLDAITSTLGSGIAIGELDVQFAPPPSPSQQDQRDRALSLALADRLGVDPSAVRVVVAKPSRLIDWQSPHASEQVRVTNDVHHTVSAMDEMPDQIVGGFTVALRMRDGTWRVVRSSSDGIESWEYLQWPAAAMVAAAVVSIAAHGNRRNNLIQTTDPSSKGDNES